MRISDWSSNVCSSDLEGVPQRDVAAVADPLVEVGADQGKDLLDRIVGRLRQGGPPDLVVLLVVVLQGLGQQGLLVLEVEDGNALGEARSIGDRGQGGRREAMLDNEIGRAHV